jgi:hypothetical protein
MADNLTSESGYINNTGRQTMPKGFDRNGLKNLMHLTRWTNDLQNM